MDQLNPKLNPIEQLSAIFPQSETADVRSHLGKFGITDKLALQKIRTLSGRCFVVNHHPGVRGVGIHLFVLNLF